MTPLNPDCFNEAYRVLQRNADTLRRQTEPDIDSLVPLVEESLQAYTICKHRLDAVRQALEAHLGPEANQEDKSVAQSTVADAVPNGRNVLPVASPVNHPSAAGGGAFDEDIPFMAHLRGSEWAV